ncbi:MAG TPA: cytochrome d ubiquinol oxidase subunit II [Steroidobacteraceae bacterium]|jgi:cytochrome d ubiquinol oxidase subunit II|nr:cytochrome d ubiquinol oxidase subunit II [Steroidobacteraceae bacterium]
MTALTGAAYWLPLICAAVIGFAVAMYIVLDGFDLGLGILFPFFAREIDRDQMMNSVAPFWDGNETWLILGGTGLFVTFPRAYAVVMPALYVPLITMLLALVFRGVAFEFRWVAKPHHRKWDIAFSAGSIVAALCQGFMLGGLLGGTRVEQGRFAGGAFDWLTPFTLLCGMGLVVGYALLGATWLVMKTTGSLERRARRSARVLLVGMLGFIVLVSVWTPLEFAPIAARWFTWPNILYLSPVPLATAIFAVACWRGLLRARFMFSPFYSAVALFIIAYIGLVISTMPYLVPPALTVWDAAAAPSSQRFVLIGIAILMPFILGYTVFVYHHFRGKVRADEGYH